MEEKIGRVEHYFTDIGVAVISLNETLEVGDKLNFKGATTDFTQEVESMEVDHEKVKKGEPGQEVGLKVENRVREGDNVLRIS